MFRRKMPTDELLSQVLFFFALLLVFGFFVSWKLIGVDTYDAEMITYLVFGGLSFLLFAASLVVFFIGMRKPFYDLVIDFDKRSIRLFYGLKEVSFDDIKLFSYNSRHRQVRLLVRWFQIGFSMDQMTTKNGDMMTTLDAQKLGEGVVVLKPKQLYNYHLIASSVFLGSYLVYGVVYGRDYVPFWGWRYIPTYWVLLTMVVLFGISYGIHRYRLYRYFRQTTNNEDTGEN